uniref:TSA: Wollemia nobilis Ref_Wollemi_Transcript_1927_2333 transcribed RNA sequence n=1 Tax=Wollemia nobilis TaxID=56998 RepID=A0A0C9RQJ4_9CONI
MDTIMDAMEELTTENRNSRRSQSQSLLNLPAGMTRSALCVNTGGVAGPEAGGHMFSTQSPSPSPSLSPSPSRGNQQYSDRFIPSRSGSNLTGFALVDKSSPSTSAGGTGSASTSGNSSSGGDGREDLSGAYSTLLRTELFGPEAAGPLSPATPDKFMAMASRNSPIMSPNRNMLRFKAAAASTSRPESPYSLSPVGPDGDMCGAVSSPPKAPRKIARSPYKVLDAPALQDDFYLNLVDWSSHNVLAVGLGHCVYLWSACSSKVTKLCDLGANDSVCSVGWTQRGTYLAVGTNIGEVQIWDATRCKKVRTLEGHRTRVGALAWSSHILSSGSRDRNIFQRDIRVQEDFVSKLIGHKSEVCGLKWSYDNRELASGGNDNQLLVWNQQSTQPLVRFSEHTAAVKAIAWSPHQHGLLASGGGTADRCIRFWNTATNSHLNCIDTGSQVCNLVWSKNVNELVSTHGYSQNQIIVWRYPTMSKLATLTGHTLRVLYLAISPDGQTIVTGAGDETLRFWNVFPSPKSQSTIRDTGIWSLGRTQIR